MSQPVCSVCKSANLVMGKRWFHEGFKLESTPLLSGYSIIPHACLDCGCITPYLDENDFQDLKAKLKK